MRIIGKRIRRVLVIHWECLVLFIESGVHNPEKAYQNQSIISFIVKVSTISINVSHLLINTWAGNLQITII